MTAALAARSGMPGELLSNGYILPPDLSLDEWSGILKLTDQIVEASPWWLCDVVAYGEATFGEQYSQALPTAEEDPEGASQARIKQAGWMASVYPAGTRVTGATYTHHRVVADLPAIERRKLLIEVAGAAQTQHPISTRALARRVEDRKAVILGRAVNLDGEQSCAAELPWTPELTDLTDAARSSLESRAPTGRLRSAFIAGALWSLVWAGVESAFLPGRWQS